MDLSDKTQLINYLKLNGLYTKHALGQNFLVDREVLDKIIETAEIEPDDLVIEVGPGVGTLTRELVKEAGEVRTVELDNKLAKLLGQLFHCSIVSLSGGKSNEAMKQCNNLEIISADILKLNINELVGNEKYKVVANIPYYITSKILNFFLTAEKKPESITLLVQKEVAERICAKPGQMSVLAISVQAYAEPEIIEIVKASSFFPAPKVDSAVLRIGRIHPFCHPALDAGSYISKEQDPGSRTTGRDDSSGAEKDFFRLVHIGFASKRKTLVNNLSAGLHLDKEKSLAIIKSIGLLDNVRAQELNVEKWVELTRIIQKRTTNC